MIKVISDSTCDLSKELIERYDITILPLHVLLGEDEYLDGVSITPDEIYKWADANKTTPKTSAPSIDDTIKLFKPFIDNGDEIICFSVSSHMSTSNNVMKLAADEIEASCSCKLCCRYISISSPRRTMQLHCRTCRRRIKASP